MKSDGANFGPAIPGGVRGSHAAASRQRPSPPAWALCVLRHSSLAVRCPETKDRTKRNDPTARSRLSTILYYDVVPERGEFRSLAGRVGAQTVGLRWSALLAKASTRAVTINACPGQRTRLGEVRRIAFGGGAGEANILPELGQVHINLRMIGRPARCVQSLQGGIHAVKLFENLFPLFLRRLTVVDSAVELAHVIRQAPHGGAQLIALDVTKIRRVGIGADAPGKIGAASKLRAGADQDQEPNRNFHRKRNR